MNLNKTAEQHSTSIGVIHGEILEAIEADILAMTAPDTAVFEEHPEFGESVATTVSRAEKSLEALQLEAEDSIATALQRGYI